MKSLIYVPTFIVIGVLYLATSLLFLHFDKLMSSTSKDSKGHRIISIDPRDTFVAIRTIWRAKYSIRRSPGMALLMYLSRTTLVVYAAMIIYFFYFVICSKT
jgi:hypothetical protein